MSNPDYVTNLENQDYVVKSIPKYSLTEGLTLTKYNQIINNVFKNLPNLNEWYPPEISKSFDHVSWKESIIKIHKEDIFLNLSQKN